MAEPTAPARSGSMWTRKTGPLALWQWMLLVLGGAIAVSIYRSKKAAKTATTTQPTTVPADQVPSVIQENFSSPITVPQITTQATTPPPPPVTSPPLNGGSPPRGPFPPVPTRPVITPVSPSPSPPAAKTKTYTIRSGDTMIGIASKVFGLPANEGGADQLYYYGNNANIIRSTAQAHGYHGPDYVAHIYPGTVLTGPA